MGYRKWRLPVVEAHEGKLMGLADGEAHCLISNLPLSTRLLGP